MLELLNYPFMQRAIIAIVLLSIIAALFGVFIVVRQMAFFADAIAHASIGGVALGLFLGISTTFTTLIISMIVASAIAYVSTRRTQSLDTIISVFYAFALSAGIIALSLLRVPGTKLNSILFGDVLGVDNFSLVLMASVTLIAMYFVFQKGKEYILMSIDNQLAAVEGVKVKRNEMFFMILLALVVAVGIKVAGIILIGPLLVIPAATAKNAASSMAGMFAISLLVALVAGFTGLLASYVIDIPSGPTIIAVSGLLFLSSLRTRLN